MAEHNKPSDQTLQAGTVSRRGFLAVTASVAAVACSPAEQEKAKAKVAEDGEDERGVTMSANTAAANQPSTVR